MAMFDRVGLIVLPEFKDDEDREKFTLDSVNVVECRANGIYSSSLREICAGAQNVSIRPLMLVAPHRMPSTAGAGARAEIVGPHDRRRRRRGQEDDMIFRSMNRHLSETRRLDILGKWYQFIGPLINKRVQASQQQLRPILNTVAAELRQHDMSSNDVERLRALVMRLGYDRAEGFSTEELVILMQEIGKDESLHNTFSHQEVLDLVQSMQSGNGKCTARQFYRAWKKSMARTAQSRRPTRELFSGYFVSFALQHVGLLPDSGDNFFAPMEFSYSTQHKLFVPAAKRGTVQEGIVSGHLQCAYLGHEYVLLRNRQLAESVEAAMETK
eukprot:TRINITY_DN54712_c0_g1_i2.p1 TRINITY_DN54712_c0_g1~~TRINITY_DN54712_c0_g1_i2.p1  ORF type:complete len:327 (+),score=128.41 TRINITY_DN54712_c0_g1_i2:75-1055(+)